MNLTHNDHLHWSITDALSGEETVFGPRKRSEDIFKFRLGQMERKPQNWWREFNIAMDKLVQEHGTDLALFYSGGSDSEIVLRVLLTLGVNPVIHTIKFTNGGNEHETAYANEFCKSANLKQVIWNFDVEKYIADQAYLDLGLRYTCSQIAYITVLEHIRKIDKTAIMGGEVYFQKHGRNDGRVKSPFEWYYIYREDEDGITYRYTEDTGHQVINEVFTYTPEVLYTWLDTPEVRSVANNEMRGKLTLLTVKKDIYEREMQTQLTARTKFNGYEMMAWRNQMVKRELQDRLPRMRTVKYEYHELMKHLRGDA
jgi:hypothetical protein